MMIWCAYCQQFLRESAPFEDLDISHGMCESCSKQGLDQSESDEKRLGQLVRLQRELYAAGQSGDLSRIEPLIRNCRDIGVRPIDMIFGFLNPMLIKLGALWEQGLITVIEEHRFTHFCEQMLRALSAARDRGGERPQFLLASADGNYHNFGLRLIQLWLEARGCSVELVTPSVPMDELLDYTIKVKPEFVGISVSLAAQGPATRSYVHALSGKENSPVRQIFIGGYAVKAGLIDSTSMAPALFIADPQALIPYLPPKQSKAA